MEEKGKDSGRVLKLPTMRGIVVLLVSMTFVLVLFATSAAAQPVKVWVNAPAYVTEGAPFVATIGVNSIEDFYGGIFDLSFDHKVAKVEDVTGGSIDDTEISISMWAHMDSDTIRVMLELPGTTTVSGSGYLAKITFKVKGDEGEESALELSDGVLVKFVFEDDRVVPEEIPAEWIDAKIGITAPPIHNIVYNIVYNINTGENFSSIQDAIDDTDTKDGHIITVSGTYSEHVVVNKRLRLTGTGLPEISVGGDGSAISVVHDGCVIEGFSVRWGDEGISVESENNLIRDNIASNNLQGIHLASASNNTFVNNTLIKNNNGICLHNSNNNRVMQNNASNNYGDGICLDCSCNNSVLNNTANMENNNGIHLRSSNDNIIANNNASCNYWIGISLDCSHNNTLVNNTMAGNKYNFGVYGDAPSHFIQNIDSSNFVDGKPIYYWVDHKDQQIPGDAGFVGLVNCTNMIVRDLILMNNGQGVLLAYTKDSWIESVNASNNEYCISLKDSSDNTIKNNTCKNSSNGIYLYKSLNNRIANNNLSSNNRCIHLLNSSNNIICNNNINSNGCGIGLYSSNNFFYLNNFVDNSENICLPPWITVVNIWYSPQMINYTYNGSSYTNYMGNYWDDYNGTDADNDGLGDTPYGINGDNKDFFPLIASFENYQPMSISEVHRVHNLDTEEDFLTIQGTIDDPDTRDGHVIEVEDGFYPENVKVTKSLTIRSENGSANCIVQAAGSDPAFNVTADYVNISGFTVKGGTDWFNAGIHLLNSSCCNISNNDCSNNFNFRGIFLSYSNNNSISNNNCLNRINGIRLEYSNNNTISNNNCTEFIQLKNSNNNIISYNDCWISLLSNSSNNTISNNNCTNNGRCTGISLGEYSSDNIISDNNCSSNGNGITLGPHSNNNSISSNNCSSNNDDGIRLMDSNTNTISNNDCSNNGMETGGRGITLWDSSNNFIAGNKVSFNGWYGIILKFDAKLSYPSNNKIIGNYISNTGRLLKPPLASGNAAGIYLTGSNDSIINNTFVNDGLYVERPTQNEVRENTVNGKPLVYLENESDREIKGAGQVILLNCDNITVENSDLSHTFIGVYLQKTNNCKIRGNNICSNIYGIYLSDSSNNKISNNNISSNSHEGIHFFFSPNNTICNNNVLNNRRYGVYLLISTSNRIYLNNFVNNSNNVSSSAKNIWNSSEKITYIYNESTYSNYLGNYWDDYTGSDTDNDGIGDIPYSTDSDNDIYPLMSPFEYYWLSLV